MASRLLTLPLALLLALGGATGVHAQAREPDPGDSTVLPVLNTTDGTLEAVLLLEPTRANGNSTRLRFGGNNTLDAVFGLSAGNTLGLVCNRKTGLANAIGNLANHCMLASLEQDAQGNGSQQAVVGATFGNRQQRVGMLAGEGRDHLPAWLSPSGQNSRYDQNSLTLYGEKAIGREATVSIGGTWARARLIPASELPAGFNERWTSKSLSLGAEVGDFGANIVGRVIDMPGQPGQWEGLGIGLTWRTPWSGQLSVGADNVVTRGQNPFAPDTGDKDEGAVPYVRYEQDL